MFKFITRTLLALAAATGVARAEVHLPPIFGDHMVLQRNAEVRLWGFAKATEEVTVTADWAGARAIKVVTDTSSRWEVVLNTPDAGGPYNIRVTGSRELILKDVLIGEVWLASGQSNMEWSARAGIDHAKQEISKAHFPQIRLFTVGHAAADARQQNLHGEWVVTTPESMADFSAVAYFFGRRLHTELNVPIGLIDSTWGGTPAEVWTPPALVEKDPQLAKVASERQPLRWAPIEPGRLFNAMIAPLIPYRIAGVIWYQGESNVGTAETYDELMEALINGWRAEWGYEFPFYFAEIAPYDYGGNGAGAALRDAQRQTLRVPRTSMVVTGDIGNIKDIHPRNKLDVGLRFARIALDQHYGLKQGNPSGPLYREMRIEAAGIRVFFDHAEGGLTAHKGKLPHFEIAGADGIFQPANAKISGITVLLEVPTGMEPRTVRHAWSDTAIPGLLNKEGLPASTFQAELPQEPAAPQPNAATADPPNLIDPDAGPQTDALFRNLARMAEQHILFGHQSTLAYGYSWVGEPGRSDVRDVTGAYPAIYGWDLQGFERQTDAAKSYDVTPENLLKWCREAYARGGVITFAWHQDNPVTGGSFNDTTRAAHTLLPGGEHHAAYRATLDKVAAFFKALDPVPVIFRPYHEHNGDWFWWGKGHVSEADFIALWRFTVDYLRKEKDVHNLIYAYSPDRSRMDMSQPERSYFYGYPGDDYVDIFGVDNYWDVGHPQNPTDADVARRQFVESLELVVRLAEKHGKIPALTETGLDTLNDPEWWSEVLLAGLDANPTTRKVAYVKVWRNANREREGRDHFYVPYKGHPSSEDFIRFKNSPLILFEDELPDLYALDAASE